MSSTTAALPPLRLQTNIPETIALAFDDGLPVTSTKGYGDQVAFSLTDGRKLYVPPTVADTIKAAGIRREQPFSICKREIKEGNRRFIRYAVEPIQNGAGAATPTPSPVTSNTPIQQSQHSNVREMPKAAVAPPPAFDSSSVALMKVAAYGAIDVVLEAEAYARSKGMTDFAFDPASIQDLVVSLFISMEKKAGRQ